MDINLLHRQQGYPIVPNLSPGAKSVTNRRQKYPKVGQNYKIIKIGKGSVLGGRIYEMLNIFTSMASEGLEIYIRLNNLILAIST